MFVTFLRIKISISHIPYFSENLISKESLYAKLRVSETLLEQLTRVWVVKEGNRSRKESFQKQLLQALSVYLCL